MVISYLCNLVFSDVWKKYKTVIHYLAELVLLTPIILVTLRNVAFISSCTTTFDTEHPRRRYISLVGSSYHKSLLHGNAPCHALACSLITSIISNTHFLHEQMLMWYISRRSLWHSQAQLWLLCVLLGVERFCWAGGIQEFERMIKITASIKMIHWLKLFIQMRAINREFYINVTPRACCASKCKQKQHWITISNSEREHSNVIPFAWFAFK